MADKAGELFYDLDLRFDKFQKSLDAIEKQTKNQTKKIDQGFKGIGKTFDDLKNKFVAAFALWKTIKGALDIQKEAAQYQQSVQAMETQFGVSSDAMISKLREVSQGTVDNQTIVLAANKAMALGVTKDTGQMATLMDYARLRAKAMGISTADAFSSITEGIGKNSPMILDNLGLITKGWAEEAKKAGVAYDNQFILNKVLQQAGTELSAAGPQVLSYAEKLEKIKATTNNMKLALGQALSDGILPLVNKMANFEGDSGTFQKVMRIISAVLITIIESASIAVRAVIFLGKSFKAAFSGILQDVLQIKLKITEAMRDLSETQLGKKLGLNSEQLNRDLNNVADQYEKAKEQTRLNISSANKEIEIMAASVQNIGNGWKNVSANIEKADESLNKLSTTQKNTGGNGGSGSGDKGKEVDNTQQVAENILKGFDAAMRLAEALGLNVSQSAGKVAGLLKDMGKEIGGTAGLVMQLSGYVFELTSGIINAIEGTTDLNSAWQAVEYNTALATNNIEAFNRALEYAKKLGGDTTDELLASQKALLDSLKLKGVTDENGVLNEAGKKQIEDRVKKLASYEKSLKDLSALGKTIDIESNIFTGDKIKDSDLANFNKYIDGLQKAGVISASMAKKAKDEKAGSVFGISSDIASVMKDIQQALESALGKTGTEFDQLSQLIDNSKELAGVYSDQAEAAAEVATALKEQLDLSKELSALQKAGLYDEQNIYQARQVARLATQQGYSSAQMMDLASSLNMSQSSASQIINVYGGYNQTFQGAEAGQVEQAARITLRTLRGF